MNRPKDRTGWSEGVLWALDDTSLLKSSGVIMSPVHEPLPEEIRIDDIAHSLARICRWAGDVDEWFSVAQHSVIVSSIVQDPRVKLYALLHDATEAYLCDVPAPAKRALPDYAAAEQKLLTVIAQKFGFTMDKHEEMMVKFADRVTLCAEARDLFYPARDFLFHEEMRRNANNYVPKIESLWYRPAEELFLRQFEKLTTGMEVR